MTCQDPFRIILEEASIITVDRTPRQVALCTTPIPTHVHTLPPRNHGIMSSSAIGSSNSFSCDGTGHKWQDKVSRMSKKVVVVGAGPAGIHAASRLRQRGFTDISIFEAGPAIGGRCITRMMHGGNVPVEAGFVANISAQNALTDLVGEYGLAVQEEVVGQISPDSVPRDGNEMVERETEFMPGSKSFSSVGRKHFRKCVGQEIETADRDEGSPCYGHQISTSSDKTAQVACDFPHSHGEKDMKSSSRPLTVRDNVSNPPANNSPPFTFEAPSKAEQSPVFSKVKTTEGRSAPSAVPSLSSFSRSASNVAASTEFKRSISNMGDKIRDTSMSEITPMRRLLSRGISNIKDQVGSLLGEEPIVGAARRYTRAHKQILGEYPLGMPPRPKPEDLSELDKTFGDWLKEHDLLDLVAVFVLFPLMLSYQCLMEMPAFYGLWWYHPQRVMGLVDSRRGALKLPRYTVLKCGWQTLWTHIADIEGLHVHLNSTIKSIRRPWMGKKGLLVVESRDSSCATGAVTPDKICSGKVPGPEMHEFDLIVIACSLKTAVPLFVDASHEERQLASSLEEYALCSTVFESDIIPGERPIELFPFPKRGGASGQVFAQFNSRLLVRKLPDEAAPQVEWGCVEAPTACKGASPAKDPRIVFQFLHRAPSAADVKMLRRRLEMFFDDQSFNEPTILKQCLWKFFPHFPTKALLESGWPWRLQNLQGHNSTLYLGASACMDALEEVLLYNDAVVQRLFPS